MFYNHTENHSRTHVKHIKPTHYTVYTFNIVDKNKDLKEPVTPLVVKPLPKIQNESQACVWCVTTSSPWFSEPVSHHETVLSNIYIYIYIYWTTLGNLLKKHSSLCSWLLFKNPSVVVFSRTEICVFIVCCQYKSFWPLRCLKGP